MLSDTLIQYYEDSVKGKVAPHTMHNLALDIAIMLLEGLSAQAPDKSVNLKQANNIWNYVILELKKRGYDPYTLEVDGFHKLMKTVKANIKEAPPVQAPQPVKAKSFTKAEKLAEDAKAKA